MKKQEYKAQLDAEIIAAIRNGSHLTFKEIGSQFGVGETYVQLLARAEGFIRKRGSGSPAAKAKRQK